MAFGDGHAQYVPMNYGLFSFNWHRNWNTSVKVAPSGVY